MSVLHGTLSLFPGPEDLTVSEQSLFARSVIADRLAVRFRAERVCTATPMCALVDRDVVKIPLSLLQRCEDQCWRAAQGQAVGLVQIRDFAKRGFSRCPARVVSANE